MRAALVKKGCERGELEWMRCTVADVQTVITELRTGRQVTGARHATFALRREQAAAVDKTHAAHLSMLLGQQTDATPGWAGQVKRD